MAANQGSRAGLTTTVVILSITSVVAVIFAFWYAAEKRKADQDLTDLKKRYADIISDASLNSPDVNELKNLRSAPDSGFTAQTKLWDVAIGQRNQLVRLITGKDTGPDNTASSMTQRVVTSLAGANTAVKSANTRVPSGTDDLLGAVSVLADKVKIQADTIADRDAKAEAADKRALDAIRSKEVDLAAKDKQIADIRAEYETNSRQLDTDRSRQQSVVSDIQKARDEEVKAHQEELSRKELELSNRSAELKQLQDQLRKTQARFDRIRVGVTDPMVRHADGTISGFGGKDIVYISLGQGKHMVPGMTFEVYDKKRGLPKIEDPTAEEQPAGKATVEVLRVLDNSSECRVTRTQPGQQLMEGDPILNIVYDPDIQYSFVVYGMFDLDRNGIATDGDTAVVKRLVTQWGGKVIDATDKNGNIRISVDTDFVVVGSEPVIPTFTDEEMTDPVNVQKLEKAKKQLAAYEEVINQTRELHIPLLNQNRFLAFTGQESAVNR